MNMKNMDQNVENPFQYSIHTLRPLCIGVLLKTKIMASGPTTSWGTDGETVSDATEQLN